MAAPRICSVEGCDKPVEARGWCRSHYYKLRQTPPCRVAGCEKGSKSKGFCPEHYWKVKEYGDPNAEVRTPRGSAEAWLKAHVGHAGNECLIWPFARRPKGYGQAWLDGQAIEAHRLMCILSHGEPPTPGHQAAHSCGNGRGGCVNPRHLRWATCSENAHEAVAHGTSSSLVNVGETHFMAKLTERDVIEIRRRLEAGDGVCAVACAYGVSSSCISQIRTRTNWHHI